MTTITRHIRDRKQSDSVEMIQMAQNEHQMIYNDNKINLLHNLNLNFLKTSLHITVHAPHNL